MTLFGVTVWQALPIFIIGWIFGATSLWRYRPICTRKHVEPERLGDGDFESWEEGIPSHWTEKR